MKEKQVAFRFVSLQIEIQVCFTGYVQYKENLKGSTLKCQVGLVKESTLAEKQKEQIKKCYP